MYYTPPFQSVNVFAVLCLSPVSLFCCGDFLASLGPAAPDAAHESGLIGQGDFHSWEALQLNLLTS